MPLEDDQNHNLVIREDRRVGLENKAIVRALYSFPRDKY